MYDYRISLQATSKGYLISFSSLISLAHSSAHAFIEVRLVWFLIFSFICENTLVGSNYLINCIRYWSDPILANFSLKVNIWYESRTNSNGFMESVVFEFSLSAAFRLSKYPRSAIEKNMFIIINLTIKM